MNSQRVLNITTTLITRIPCGGSQFPARMASSRAEKLLNMQNINPNVLTMEYAVRGPIVIRAVELEKELAKVRF